MSGLSEFEWRALDEQRRTSLDVFRDGSGGAARASSTGPLEQRAFWSYVTAPAQIFQHEERVLSKAASGGGFLVPTDVADLVVAAARASSAVAQVAAEFVTARGELLGVSLAGTHGTAAWIAESGSYTPSDETITQQNLNAFKAGTKLIASEELLQDQEVGLDAYLASELGRRIGALQENAFVLGDGSGKPLGIVNASSGYTVVTAATGSATAFKLADVKAVYKALPLAYRPNATWLMNGDDYAELAALTDSAGGLLLPSLQAEPPSLFGRPVLASADLPAPAANAKSIAFGDWKLAYGIRRVNELSIKRQEEIHSDAGQVGYKAFWRVDGRPLLPDAARILAHSAT